eukprot:CAMPEP_0114578666 /NCGR_PEP_ID=MMETSP0125-20121206/3175_1 /TAXON_ID=485358 ORGANISM="Aristerostoma sp., Strain ATCC 50986" /NCGR_SAMPLE_ID=MMETSP0125 /ASSEMBLY_ACC=CAM_ASM_000245 /LENGTH=256 /DNA_ID=CAMNT_0001768903 /DNA_START=1973 /DNA_END=2746 /DNA_ORIENTATION=+
MNMSILNDSKMLNETIDMKNLGVVDDINLQKSIKKPSYAQMFNEDAKSNPELVGFLFKAFTIFEKLDAGGMILSEVMAFDEKYQLSAFKHFMNALEIWGSFFPLERVSESDIKDSIYFLTSSVTKLKELIKRIDLLLSKYKSKPLLTQSNQLAPFVIEDLELISHILPSVYQKLSIKVDQLLELDEENIPKSPVQSMPDNNGEQFIKINQTPEKNQKSSDRSILGHLIPFSCGHSGIPRGPEIDIYEFHLRNARMI